MVYEAQYAPGETKIAENRRRHINPSHELEKMRNVADEDVVKLLGHKNPGEGYKTVCNKSSWFIDGNCTLKLLMRNPCAINRINDTEENIAFLYSSNTSFGVIHS